MVTLVRDQQLIKEPLLNAHAIPTHAETRHAHTIPTHPEIPHTHTIPTQARTSRVHVIPAQAGISRWMGEIPAYAGMTDRCDAVDQRFSRREVQVLRPAAENTHHAAFRMRSRAEFSPTPKVSLHTAVSAARVDGAPVATTVRFSSASRSQV